MVSAQGEGGGSGDGEPSSAGGRARRDERFEFDGGLAPAHREGEVQPRRGQLLPNTLSKLPTNILSKTLSKMLTITRYQTCY